jgi:hypothetical protein
VLNLTTHEVQVGEDVRQVEPERDFTGTPHIPIYVMLPVCMFIFILTLLVINSVSQTAL